MKPPRLPYTARNIRTLTSANRMWHCHRDHGRPPPLTLSLVTDNGREFRKPRAGLINVTIILTGLVVLYGTTRRTPCATIGTGGGRVAIISDQVAGNSYLTVVVVRHEYIRFFYAFVRDVIKGVFVDGATVFTRKRQCRKTDFVHEANGTVRNLTRVEQKIILQTAGG